MERAGNRTERGDAKTLQVGQIVSPTFDKTLKYKIVKVEDHPEGGKLLTVDKSSRFGFHGRGKIHQDFTC